MYLKALFFERVLGLYRIDKEVYGIKKKGGGRRGYKVKGQLSCSLSGSEWNSQETTGREQKIPLLHVAVFSVCLSVTPIPPQDEVSKQVEETKTRGLFSQLS